MDANGQAILKSILLSVGLGYVYFLLLRRNWGILQPVRWPRFILCAGLGFVATEIVSMLFVTMSQDMATIFPGIFASLYLGLVLQAPDQKATRKLFVFGVASFIIAALMDNEILSNVSKLN